VKSITCLRFPLAVVIVYLIGTHQYGWALATILFGMFTDWIDGPLARFWNATTDFGRDRLEPLADTALIASVVLGATIADIFPWWLMVMMLALHLSIDFGIKRILPRPDRIIFFQALAMEIGLVAACAYLIHHVDNRLFIVGIPFIFLVPTLKHRRIRDFKRWCFRKE
jgi:phosphatidylglycerophosphate synthase